MAITGREFELEERRLVEVSKLLDDQLAKMGENIFEDEEKFQEFKRYSLNLLKRRIFLLHKATSKNSMF